MKDQSESTATVPELGSDALFDAIYQMTPEQREFGTVTVNRWGWPPELDAFKPQGFDEMGAREKFALPIFQAVRSELERWVSPVAKSWAWWRIAIGDRTIREHREWWAENHPSSNVRALAPATGSATSQQG